MKKITALVLLGAVTLTSCSKEDKKDDGEVESVSGGSKSSLEEQRQLFLSFHEAYKGFSNQICDAGFLGNFSYNEAAKAADGKADSDFIGGSVAFSKYVTAELAKFGQKPSEIFKNLAVAISSPNNRIEELSKVFLKTVAVENLLKDRSIDYLEALFKKSEVPEAVIKQLKEYANDPKKLKDLMVKHPKIRELYISVLSKQGNRVFLREASKKLGSAANILNNAIFAYEGTCKTANALAAGALAVSENNSAKWSEAQIQEAEGDRCEIYNSLNDTGRLGAKRAELFKLDMVKGCQDKRLFSRVQGDKLTCSSKLSISSDAKLAKEGSKVWQNTKTNTFRSQTTNAQMLRERIGRNLNAPTTTAIKVQYDKWDEVYYVLIALPTSSAAAANTNNQVNGKSVAWVRLGALECN